MKTTFASPSIMLVSALGVVLLAVIVAVALYTPARLNPSTAGSPVNVIEAAPATALPGDPVEIIETPTVLPITANVEFTLQTVANNGRFAFIGIGGEIEGVTNPDLSIHPGDTVRLILVNGDGMPHDFFLPDFDAQVPYVTRIGDQADIVFEVGDVPAGTYVYYCTVPGHRQLGQEGKLIVSEP